MESDCQLLRRYLEAGDQGAFAELVRRHGPMVRAACRRLAGADAEDAEQAVFILLAEKARKLASRWELGSWLHGACRLVARTAGRERARRARREKEAAAMHGAQETADISPEERGELRRHLDEAVGALPERFRQVVVLCHLEGASQQEAAERLGLPLGTVATRSRRGIERLRGRLARRGLGLSVAALGAWLLEGAAGSAEAFEPGALLSSVAVASKASAAGAAAGAAGSKAALLAEGAMKAMFWMKVKLAAAALGAAAVLGASVPAAVAVVQAGEAGGEKGGVAAQPQPVQPAPKPAVAGGARVQIFTSDGGPGDGKIDEKQVTRAVTRAKLVVIVETTEIEKPAEGKKVEAVGGNANFGVNRLLIAGAGAQSKSVKAKVVEVLKGEAGAKELSIQVQTTAAGKEERVVLTTERTVRVLDGRETKLLSSTLAPFTLKKGKKSLVFLMPAGEAWRLRPPLPDGTPEEVLAMVRKTLQKIAEWGRAPKLSEAEARAIGKLIGELADEDFKKREAATAALIAKGEAVRGKVREALKSPDAETSQRAGRILEAITPKFLKEPPAGALENRGVVLPGGGGRVQIQMHLGQ